MDFDAPAKASPWNSLEIMKLLVAFVTPVMLAYIAYVVSSAQNDVSQLRQREQTEAARIREFRWEMYKEAGPLLNDIFTYHFYVGHWKEFTPQTVLDKKRRLDTLMYSHQSLFTSDFFENYRAFMTESFKVAGGWNQDARIRTMSRCRKRAPAEQESDWNGRFTQEDNRKPVCLAYKNLLGSLSKELLFVSLSPAAVGCPDYYDVSICSP